MNLEQLKEGSTVIGDSGNDPKTLPDWMDRERFKRGQQFFQRHRFAVSFAVHCSLTVGFGVSSIVEPLAFTKKSETAPKALARYLKTYAHYVLWHMEDVWDENTLGYKSVQTVRKMHNAVRQDLESQISTKSYVTQYDMALVQTGFMGAVVVYPSHFGIKCTQEELEDYVFFWRGIGYLLGIKDEFNLCSGNYEETKSLCKEVEQQVMHRGLLQPPPEFEPLSSAYLNGMNSLLKYKAFTMESITAFYLNFAGLSLPGLKLSWVDRLRLLRFRFMVFLIRWMPGFERFTNYLAIQFVKRILSTKQKELARENATV